MPTHINRYIADWNDRLALCDYLTSEGIDPGDARSLIVHDDGRLEVEMYLRDANGDRAWDHRTLTVPTAVRTIDPIFAIPADLLARLSPSLAA